MNNPATASVKAVVKALNLLVVNISVAVAIVKVVVVAGRSETGKLA